MVDFNFSLDDDWIDEIEFTDDPSPAACEVCGRRLEDCECEPGFPDLVFCPVQVYDPQNHDPATCPFCNQLDEEE